jgi:hypothetical protein
MLRLSLRNLKGCNVGIADDERRLDAVMINLLSLMMAGTGVKSILRFSSSNSNACNIGITDGKEL